MLTIGSILGGVALGAILGGIILLFMIMSLLSISSKKEIFDKLKSKTEVEQNHNLSGVLVYYFLILIAGYYSHHLVIYLKDSFLQIERLRPEQVDGIGLVTVFNDIYVANIAMTVTIRSFYYVAAILITIQALRLVGLFLKNRGFTKPTATKDSV